MMWLPVYKSEPDDDADAAAEVMYYQRLAAERTIQAKYEYAAWRMRPVCKSILLPAAPVAPRFVLILINHHRKSYKSPIQYPYQL